MVGSSSSSFAMARSSTCASTDLAEEVTGIVRSDPPAQEPEDGVGVTVEDLSEPTGVDERLLHQLGIRQSGHILSLPPDAIAVRDPTPRPGASGTQRWVLSTLLRVRPPSMRWARTSNRST
jgi:hypothetical protein